MKTVFVYNAGHPVHRAWASSIGAQFLEDRVHAFRGVRNFPRLLKSVLTLFRIPPHADLLLCESGSQILTGALWKLFNKQKKLALILSDPKMYYIPLLRPVKRKLYMWALSKYDLFIPTSPMMASLIPRRLNGQIRIVPPYAVNKHLPARADLANRNIIFFGRISREKGTDSLLDMFAKLVRDVTDAQLYVLGFSLDAMQKTLELRNIRNVFFPGRVSNDELEDYLTKCSIYVSLARIDPAGVAVLEAMHKGIVPVVSEGLGNSYIVRQIDEALVVRTHDEAITIIKKLWSSPKFIKHCSDRAIAIANKYDEAYSIHMFKEVTHQFMS